MKLSKIFRKAQLYVSEDTEYSCSAIALATSSPYAMADKQLQNALTFASKYGVDPGSKAQFNEFRWGEERQVARFMWLELLA